MTFIIFQQLASLLTAVPLVYDRNFLCDSFDRCTFSLSWKCFIWQLRPFAFDVDFFCDSLGSCAFLSLFEMSFRQLCHHCSHFLGLGLVSGFQWLHLRGGFPKNKKNYNQMERVTSMDGSLGNTLACRSSHASSNF